MTLNLPNILTLARVIAIPVMILFYYFFDFFGDNLGKEMAAWLFVAAAITDWLDGFLARRWNQTSSFGAFLDPVADKLLVAAALLVLTYDQRVHALIAIIIIGREITISALREWMAELGQRSKVKVNNLGKYKTAAQMTAIPMLLHGQTLFGVDLMFLGKILIVVATALTIVSMFVYLKAAWPMLTEENARGAAPSNSVSADEIVNDDVVNDKVVNDKVVNEQGVTQLDAHGK